MSYELRKPPVTEAWIEFKFSVSEEHPAWDEVTGKEFIERAYGERFKTKQFIGRQEMTFEAKEGRPSLREARLVFERVLAANADEDRYVQAGRDQLIYNIVRKQQCWPEYSALRDEALDVYGQYVLFAKPSGLQTLALHYRDVVRIPLPATGSLDLSRFFTVCPDAPSGAFGSVSNWAIDLTLPYACKDATLRLVIRDDPPAHGSEPAGITEAMFRMDWHAFANRTVGLEPQLVREWLEAAHEELLTAFKAAFTQECWALFEPTE
jgi:uncharacterized protein (TIGR04255 family)